MTKLISAISVAIAFTVPHFSFASTDNPYCVFFDTDGQHPGTEDDQGYDGDFFRFEGTAYQAEIEFFPNLEGATFRAVAKRDGTATEGILSFSVRALSGFNFEVGSATGSVGSIFCGRHNFPNQKARVPAGHFDLRLDSPFWGHRN